MGEQKGKMLKCDRCKEGSVFLKYLGQAGLSNYAGPGTYDKFEDMPKNWIYDTRFGYLCPECAKEFVTMMRHYFGEEKYSNIASCWQIEEEEELND